MFFCKFHQVKPTLNQQPSTTPTPIVNNVSSIKHSALSIKRAQFQNTKAVESVERKRPPLIRAMSAPIRPIIDDPLKMQAKRKTRRRKILR